MYKLEQDDWPREVIESVARTLDMIRVDTVYRMPEIDFSGTVYWVHGDAGGPGGDDWEEGDCWAELVRVEKDGLIVYPGPDITSTDEYDILMNAMSALVHEENPPTITIHVVGEHEHDE